VKALVGVRFAVSWPNLARLMGGSLPRCLLCCLLAKPCEIDGWKLWLVCALLSLGQSHLYEGDDYEKLLKQNIDAMLVKLTDDVIANR